MVRKLPPEARKRVVQLWLDGNSYVDIHHKAGPSKGTSSSIISQLREEVPEIDELRNLNIALKNANAKLADALKGAQFLGKLTQLDIQISRIPACISLLNQYGKKAGDVLESAQRLQELEASQGKTYEQIIANAAEKVKQLEDAETSLERLRRQEATIKSSLPELEQLKALKEKISSFGLKPEHLDSYINYNKRLQKLGFTLQTAELLASELENLALNPQNAATTLSKLLSQYGSLETAVAGLQKEKVNLQNDIDAKKPEHKGLIERLQTLKGEVDQYQNLLENQKALHQARIDQLEKEYAKRREELEAEVKDHQKKREALENEIQGLKIQDETVRTKLREAEAGLANIEEKVARTRPLGIFASLTEDPQSQLPPATLLEVSASFVNGLRSHIEANRQVVSNPQELRSKLEQISRTLMVEHRLATRKVE